MSSRLPRLIPSRESQRVSRYRYLLERYEDISEGAVTMLVRLYDERLAEWTRTPACHSDGPIVRRHRRAGYVDCRDDVVRLLRDEMMRLLHPGMTDERIIAEHHRTLRACADIALSDCRDLCEAYQWRGTKECLEEEQRKQDEEDEASDRRRFRGEEEED